MRSARVAALFLLITTAAMTLLFASGSTQPATSVSSDSATLTAKISLSKGENLSYSFDYRKRGTSSWSHTTTRSTGLASTNTTKALTQPVSGLTADTAYEYRLAGTLTAAPKKTRKQIGKTVYYGSGGAGSTSYSTFRTAAAPAAPVQLTVGLAGDGSGLVSGVGVSCPSDCSESFTQGASVTLTATAVPGSEFAGWSGACSGVSPSCSVTMTQARAVTATFSKLPPPSYALDVSTSGTGSGSVSGPGIACPGDCSESFTQGASVTLTATADLGSSFTGWSGACSGSTSTCTLTMSQARTTSANFNTVAPPPPSYTLSVSKTGDGSGAVTGSGISCGSDCSETYLSGTSVTLTAAAASGSDFAGWSGGGCSGTGSCVVSMTQARSVTATFNETPTGEEPPFGLPLIKKLDQVGDWNSVLDRAPGSSITNQPDGSIRIWQPGDGERTELQVHRPADGGVPSHGYETFYTWEFKISPSTTLYSGHNTISQFHGNNNAGYTGGTVIGEDRPPEQLILRVKGGKQLSTSGSHRYEFESDRGDYAVPQSTMTTSSFQRGVWNKVEYHVLWTDKWNGYAKMRFNGGPWFGVENVPTSSDIADVQMFRLGWYPGSDNVPSGGLEMFVRNTAVYGKAVSYP